MARLPPGEPACRTRPARPATAGRARRRAAEYTTTGSPFTRFLPRCNCLQVRSGRKRPRRLHRPPPDRPRSSALSGVDARLEFLGVVKGLITGVVARLLLWQ